MVIESFPSDEMAAINKLLTSTPGEFEQIASATQSAVRELDGGLPMTSPERFVLFLYVIDVGGSLEEVDALRRGLTSLMRLIDQGWSGGLNMGDHWANHDSCHPEALLLLDLVVRRSLGSKGMVRAVNAGLSSLRNGDVLPDRHREKLSSWRWNARGVWSQAVDALLLAIDRRVKS